MTITYELGENLYVNVTNQCPNACDFCVRGREGAFTDDLWLPAEPSEKQLIDDILSRDLKKYPELVFCGFGEPLEELDKVLAACRAVREANKKIKIRINTAGLANLKYKTDVTPRFLGLVDSLSISLNAKNAQEYDSACHSIYGPEAFDAMLDFAKKSKQYVPDVQFTVVDLLPKADIAACQQLADSLGIALRVRPEIK